MVEKIALPSKRFKRFNKRFGKEKYPYRYGMAFSLFFDIFRLTHKTHPLREIVHCDKEESLQYIKKYIVMTDDIPS